MAGEVTPLHGGWPELYKPAERGRFCLDCKDLVIYLPEVEKKQARSSRWGLPYGTLKFDIESKFTELSLYHLQGVHYGDFFKRCVKHVF